MLRRIATITIISSMILPLFFSLPVKAAARSTHVIIKNDTEYNMTYISGKLQHGISVEDPDDIIPPSGFGELRSESNGFMTGTEGTVRYRLDGIDGTASFHWDNPFSGGNSADGSAPAGFEIQQIGNKGNRTLVFFSIHVAGNTVASCNPDWVINHLGTHAEDALTDTDENIGWFTTPFKRLGFGGWVDTGCEASGDGWAVRSAQGSTDGFYTIDVRLNQFTIDGRNMQADQKRFVRIEVEPNTPAHAHAGVEANEFISFHGHILIDTHHGDELIEVHPTDPITLADMPGVVGVEGAYPINDFHDWDNILIQDWRGGQCGECAYIASKGGEFRPYYVGGGVWVAYKRARWDYGIIPGYPINEEHDWGAVRIQDFRGGSLGDTAIIGGDNAEIVTGSMWNTYILADGPNRLRNPTSPANDTNEPDGYGQGMKIQNFEGGRILLNSRGQSWVDFYDTGERIPFFACPTNARCGNSVGGGGG